jgi:hypothetical protein
MRMVNAHAAQKFNGIKHLEAVFPNQESEHFHS